MELTLAVGEEVVAILGPNGAGKTTLLRALAGIEPITQGRITLDGQLLDDPEEGVFVAAKDRSVGVVFQDYLLFPFLSVRENVAFSLRSRGVPRREARARAEAWLGRVGLAEYASVRPGSLSGGQAQRVAIARAVVGNPRLLLLDEPLSALDAGSHLTVRRELREHLAQIAGPRLIVTHDPVDATSLADRVVILEGGRIIQDGSMSEIALHPGSNYVANLVGLNLFLGDATDGLVRLRGGGLVQIADRGVVGEVRLVIHPRAVSLHLADVRGSARNHWHGTIVDLDDLNGRVRVEIKAAITIVAEVTSESARELGLTRGQQIYASVKATEIEVHSS